MEHFMTIQYMCTRTRNWYERSTKAYVNIHTYISIHESMCADHVIKNASVQACDCWLSTVQACVTVGFLQYKLAWLLAFYSTSLRLFSVLQQWLHIVDIGAEIGRAFIGRAFIGRAFIGTAFIGTAFLYLGGEKLRREVGWWLGAGRQGIGARIGPACV